MMGEIPLVIPEDSHQESMTNGTTLTPPENSPTVDTNEYLAQAIDRIVTQLENIQQIAQRMRPHMANSQPTEEPNSKSS